jgi:hypothetical protein
MSQMLDAGIAIDKVSKLIGHASITITIDRYGHVLPGGEADAIALLDAYHQRSESQPDALDGSDPYARDRAMIEPGTWLLTMRWGRRHRS